MKVFRLQYEATDDVSDIIARMINYVSLEPPMQQPQLTIINGDASSPPQEEHFRSDAVSPLVMTTKALSIVNDWGGVLLRQPNIYLRFALTIDLALERGHFPNDSDFPATLQWRNTSTARFPMYRITMGGMDYKSESSAKAEKLGCENQAAVRSNKSLNYDNTTGSQDDHTSPTSMSPSTEGAFVSQTVSVSAQNNNYQNYDLELAMDFDSFAMVGPDDVAIEFNHAISWPDESFLISN